MNRRLLETPAGQRDLVRAITDGPVIREVPAGALVAKRCRCEEPWIERDADGDPHCVRCGRGIGR